MDVEASCCFICVVCLLLMLPQTLVTASLERCPPIVRNGNLRPYYSTSFREKCYTFVHNTQTWLDAKRHCNNWGGDLVGIPDKATMDFLIRVFNSRRWYVSFVWNGLNARSGKWKWSNGRDQTWGYWARGQPSTFLGISYEDCGCMKRTDSWRWHDCLCDTFIHKNRYVCEFGMLPTTTTSTTTTTTTTTITTTSTTSPTTTPRPTTTTPRPKTRKITRPSSSNTPYITKEPSSVRSTTPSSTPNILVVMKFNPKISKVESKSRDRLYHDQPEYHGVYQDPSQAASSDDEETTVDRTALLVGFGIGGILLLAIIIFAFVFFRRRRKRKQPNEEYSVRFENLGYARVNQTDSQRPQSNVYMDANEMNRLYEEVTKQVNHGVNYYSVNNTVGSVPPQNGAAGGPDDCYGVDDVSLKKPTHVNTTKEGDCSPPASQHINNETDPIQESEYLDMSGASGHGPGAGGFGPAIIGHGPKETNLQMEAQRVIDPDKPSNIQLEPIYNNGPGSLPPESATPAYNEQELPHSGDQASKEDHLYDTVK